MAFKVADFVQETSTTTGLTDFALGGAVAEHQAFSAFMSNGDTTLYSAKLGSEWEVGIGTWVTGPTLQRTIVRGSSNAGAKVSFSAGSKIISCVPTAAAATIGKHAMPIPAVACRPRTTNGATAFAEEQTTNDIMVLGYTFDNDVSDQAIQVGLVLPNQIDVAFGITFIFHWKPNGASSGDVIWGARARALSNDDAIDGAWGTAVTATDTFIASGDHHISPETSLMTVGNSWQAGDKVMFEFYRDSDSASDTLNGDAVLTDVVAIVYSRDGHDI